MIKKVIDMYSITDLVKLYTSKNTKNKRNMIQIDKYIKPSIEQRIYDYNNTLNDIAHQFNNKNCSNYFCQSINTNSCSTYSTHSDSYINTNTTSTDITSIRRSIDTIDNILINDKCTISECVEDNILAIDKCICSKDVKYDNIIIDGKSTHNIYIDNPDQVYEFQINCVNVCFLTMVAGGGAGGIGFIKDIKYYSGSGGGSGACIIKRPIKIKKCSILRVKVGKGGTLMTNNGEDSEVEIINCGTISECIKVFGGCNGSPSYEEVEYYRTHDIPSDKVFFGGCSGKHDQCDTFSGRKGADGNISYMSQLLLSGGCGCSNIFMSGGKGGSSIFMVGGSGGLCKSITNYDKNLLIGCDGKFGSGGGGSCARLKPNYSEKLSGNGGNGFILIEW